MLVEKQQEMGDKCIAVLLLILLVLWRIAKRLYSRLNRRLAFRVSGLLSHCGRVGQGCYEYYSPSQTTNKPLDIAEMEFTTKVQERAQGKPGPNCILETGNEDVEVKLSTRW